MISAADEQPATTGGALLGGRVVYRQPEHGYRTGIEPVLLAASLRARPGERVIEGGAGAGAGLLAATSRLGRFDGLGLEIDPSQAALARQNFAANGFDFLSMETVDLESWLPTRGYDHAFANPPWHDPAGTRSPMEGRRRAKLASAGLLHRWATSLASGLRHRGTLSFIVPGRLFAEGSAALQASGCAEICLIPLRARPADDARLVILRGSRLGRGDCTLRRALVLHTEDGRYTAEAEAILRDGAPLDR